MKFIKKILGLGACLLLSMAAFAQDEKSKHPQKWYPDETLKTGTFVHNVHNLRIRASWVTMHVVHERFLP